MARAGNDAQFRLPCREAPQMRAHGAEREVAFLRVNDVDSRVHIKRDGIERIPVGLASIDYGRGFVQHIRLEELICERSCASSRYPERAQAKFRKELPAVDRVFGLCSFGFVFHVSLLTYFDCNPAPIAAIEINPVGSAGIRLYDSMVIVPTGQRMAQRPQRMQRVSSFNMAEPVTMPSSLAATSSNSTPNSSWLSRMCCTAWGSNSMRLSETNSKHFSGQTSTQPPHSMHMLPSSGVPSKIVLTQQCRQRCASAIASGAS